MLEARDYKFAAGVGFTRLGRRSGRTGGLRGERATGWRGRLRLFGEQHETALWIFSDRNQNWHLVDVAWHDRAAIIAVGRILDKGIQRTPYRRRVGSECVIS